MKNEAQASSLDQLIGEARRIRHDREQEVAPTVESCIGSCLEYDENFRDAKKFFESTTSQVRVKIQELHEDLASRLSDTDFYYDFVPNDIISYQGIGETHLHGEVTSSQKLNFFFPSIY